MKKTLLCLTSLIGAASVNAHVTGVPHTHNENPFNWATLLTIAAAIAVSVIAFKSFRKINKG